MGGFSPGRMAVCRVGVSASLLCLSAAPAAFTTQGSSTGARRSNIPYVAARSIVDALPPDRLPAGLWSKTPAEPESAWLDWVAGRDRDIRARLALGDEESVFNLTLFGTTFTDQRPVTERDMMQAQSYWNEAQTCRAMISLGFIDSTGFTKAQWRW